MLSLSPTPLLPDRNGFYDTQYKDRSHPDCRGRLRTDKDGRFAYRAVVPVAYPIPGDVRILYFLHAYKIVHQG